jgi:hypothetical protein
MKKQDQYYHKKLLEQIYTYGDVSGVNWGLFYIIKEIDHGYRHFYWVQRP